MIAIMLEDFLDAVGRTVTASVDSVEGALAAIDEGGFDAAIVDRNLRGGELSDPVAEALASRGIPFAISTGERSGAMGPFLGRPCLLKPYTMMQLDGVLAELDGTRMAA